MIGTVVCQSIPVVHCRFLALAQLTLHVEAKEFLIHHQAGRHHELGWECGLGTQHSRLVLYGQPHMLSRHAYYVTLSSEAWTGKEERGEMVTCVCVHVRGSFDQGVFAYLCCACMV